MIKVIKLSIGIVMAMAASVATVAASEDVVAVESIIQDFTSGLGGRPASNPVASPSASLATEQKKSADEAPIDTSRAVAARVRLSAPYADRYALRSDVLQVCAPVIALLPKGQLTQEQLVSNLVAFSARWPHRSYEVIRVARLGNIVEIQVRYHCRGPETYNAAKPPRTTQGYTLMTIHLDEQGKIKAMGEKTSKAGPPPFSPGMQVGSYRGPRVFGT